MEIVGKGNGSSLLSKLPAPSRFLCPVSKKYYQKIGKTLITSETLKSIHLVTLEMLASNCAQWEFAVKAIGKKERKESGTGYIQKYSTGATNITTELVLKRDAEKAIERSIAAFGMDPQSEKKLKQVADPGQGQLFPDFMKQKNS